MAVRMSKAIREDQREADTAASKLSVGAISWAIFQGSRDCYAPLILVFIFLPYFSTIVIGNSVEAQEMVSRWNAWSSIAIMFTAPLLGASIDQLGPRKGVLMMLVAVMAPLMGSLWWAMPDGGGLGIVGTLMVITVIGVLFCNVEVLHNSLLIRAASLANAHKASGLGSGLSSAMSVVLLIVCLWAFVLPGKIAAGWISSTPLLGLKQSLHEPERIVGPIASLVFLVGSAPLFLFTSDAPKTGQSFVQAVRSGICKLILMARAVHLHRDAAIFLVARMFFVDGMTALLLYLGIYASGVMRWGSVEMLIVGIFVSIFGALGGFVGAALDKAVGPKRALQAEIITTFLGVIALLGMAPDRILYCYYPRAHTPLWNGSIFRTLPELVFLFIACCNATAIVAHYASSRTLLTRLTPADQTGTFFGIFALSGTATLWLGSLMVNLGTGIFHSQRAGFSSICILLVTGFLGLLFVQGGGRLEPIYSMPKKAYGGTD